MSDWSDINTAMDAAEQIGRDDGPEEPDDPSAAGYRWDWHYRRATHQGKDRCTALREGPWGRLRCEYVVHPGRAHAARDGSLQWTDPQPEVSPAAAKAMAAHDAGFTTAADLAEYRRLAGLVAGEGPECVICGRRGLNLGRFAQPRDDGAWHVHIGCEADQAREQERDTPEAQQ